MAFYAAAGAAAYAAFRVAAEFAAILAVRHYSNALDAYMWLLLAVLVLVPILVMFCLLYTSPSPRDATLSRMPSSA